MAELHLKETSHIILRTFLKGFALFFLGGLISAIGFFWGWHLIWDNISGTPGPGGALIFLLFPIIFFKVEFWTGVLIDFCLLSLFLYGFLAYKIALASAFREVWSTHLAKPAVLLLKAFFEHLSKKNANWIHSLKDGKKLKNYLLKGREAFKDLPFFQRTLLSFGLKKIRIEETLQACRSEGELAQMLGIKIEEAIRNSLASSKRIFYILVVLQLILMVIATVFSK